MPDKTITIEDTSGDEAEVTFDTSISPTDGVVRIYADDEDMYYDAENARALRDALNEALGESQTTVVNNFSAPAGVTRKLASELPFNEAIVRLAIVHDKSVVFRYAKGDGRVIETRILKPSAVANDAEVFNGIDPDRDEFRAFRFDRVKGEVAFA